MDDMDGMDMGGTTIGSTTSTMSSMDMGFHMTPFDQLWFAGWQPQTNGAFAGACVGLFLLAVVERWVSALRGLAEGWWRQRTDAIVAARQPMAKNSLKNNNQSGLLADEKRSLSDAGTSDVEDCCLNSNDPTPPTAYTALPPVFPTRLSSITRTLPPFIWSHDLSRGAFQVLQGGLGYALMLAFMAYNWGYCLAILAGLGVGDVMFGRFGSGGGGHNHGSS